MKLSKLNNLLAMSAVCLLLSGLMMAQVKTDTSTTQGQATVETKVERGEVVFVSGNDLIIKMEDGQIRNFDNVPESVKVTVNGQQLSVSELKPGMKLERTITTTTTPQTVTTVQTVRGKVWHVSPPTMVILTLEDGTNQEFQIPKGQKFTVEGQEVDAYRLRKGMDIEATKIVTAPETVVAEERKVTGQMPPPPRVEIIHGPLLVESKAKTEQPAQVAQAEPAKPEPAQPQAAPKELPKTAGELPLIALIGTALLLLGIVRLVWARAR